MKHSHVRCTCERDIRNCNIFLFTETWLNPSKADHSIKPMETLSVYQSDRTFEESKKEIGGGVAVMVNEGWCHSGNITVLRRFCSPEVESRSESSISSRATALVMAAQRGRASG